MDPGTDRVGVVGLGAMGRPMTEQLLRRPDTPVAIHGRGRDPYADLLDAGARWHDTACSLAAESSVVLLMLPDLAQVEEVLAGDDGLLAAEPTDLLLVVSSTSSPTGVRRLGERLARETDGRVRVVDAPVSGGVDGAEAGTLSIMVGGPDDDARRAMAVLEECGRSYHLGPLGSGEVAKACNQLIVSAAVLALVEAAVLADRRGLELDTLFELFKGGYADSRILRTRAPRMVVDDFSPSGPARYLVKDLEFATDVATATRTDAAAPGRARRVRGHRRAGPGRSRHGGDQAVRRGAAPAPVTDVLRRPNILLLLSDDHAAHAILRHGVRVIC